MPWISVSTEPAVCSAIPLASHAQLAPAVQLDKSLAKSPLVTNSSPNGAVSLPLFLTVSGDKIEITEVQIGTTLIPCDIKICPDVP